MNLTPNTQTLDLDTLLTCSLQWVKAGHGVALATVTRTWGSSPCPVGSHLVVRDDGAFEGSVSGGCIEGEVVTESLAVMRTQIDKRITFGIANEDAWRVGLSCGGKIEIYIIALVNKLTINLKRILAAKNRKIPTALLMDMTRARTFVWAGDLEEKDTKLSCAKISRLTSCFESDRSGFITRDDEPDLFARIYNPNLRLLICGAVHIAQHLANMAMRGGYDVTVIDPRDTWSTEARFPGIKLDRRWPSAAIDDLNPDARTAIVTLSHDSKLDDPTLIAAIESDAFYIGSLGSQRTHAARLSRLKGNGATDIQLKRIHAPIGLDIGAESPAEIAVSALAQITAKLRKPALN